MKIAFFSRHFFRTSLEKAFRVAGEYGYDGLELWGGRPHFFPEDLTDDRIGEIIGMKEKYGIETPMLSPEVLNYPYGLASFDKATRKDTVEYFKGCIQWAAKVYCPRVQIAVGHTGYGTDRKKALDNLRETMLPIIESAEAHDINLVIEPLTMIESNLMIMLDDVIDFIDTFASDRLKYMIDTVTPSLHCETMADYFEKMKDRMDYVHFVGADRVSYHHYVPDEGIVPMDEVLKIFLRHDYKGWISVELNEPEIWDPELSAGRSITVIRKMLENIGN